MKKLVLAVATRLAVIPVSLAVLAIAALRPITSRVLRGRFSKNGGGLTIAVVSTFYNRNWCIAHLAPIARAANVGRVIAVVNGPTSPIANVTYVFPSEGMQRVFGRLLTKLFLLFKIVVTERADVVIGYTLIPNGLWALIVSSLMGRQVIYQNPVGPTEIVGGGFRGTDTPLRHLQWNSWTLEKIAKSLTRRFDAVVVRGKEAVGFLESNRLTARPCVLVGAIDPKRFCPGNPERSHRYDIVTVGRMVEIKQLHHFISTAKKIKDCRGGVMGAIVGDGPLTRELQQQVADLGLDKEIEFLGQIDAVEDVLRESRVFVLTSSMEGLSIALAEAMACGLPAVVSDVGELGELVQDGITGWRVKPGDIDAYAMRIMEILDSPAMWRRLSLAAQRRALENNGLEAVASRWSELLEEIVKGEPKGIRLNIGECIDETIDSDVC
jgi:glycosyltransferase involved in cell wall biosynthesis